MPLFDIAILNSLECVLAEKKIQILINLVELYAAKKEEET